MNQTCTYQRNLSITLVIGMILTSSASAGEVENLLMDPDFEEPVLGWSLSRRAPAAATLTIDNQEKKFGQASARIDITNVGNGASDHNLTLDNNAGISVTANTTYTVDFWAKAEAARTLILDSLLNQAPWTRLFRVRDLPVTTEWTVIHHTFQASATMSPVVFLFSFVDSETTIWLDHVRFYEGEYDEEDINLKSAYAPNPAPDADDVWRDSSLSWTPGEFASTHDVYLGTAFDDVNDASSANPMDVLVSSGQDANSFDPGRLAFGQTYYWRVDEVNSAPDFTVFKGEVWTFTVEPFSIPISGVTATASSSNSDVMGPEKTIDGSGLNELDQHSTTATDMWLSAAGPAPWIQYEFDKTYKLDQLIVWNSNQLIESFLGFGARDVTIEYSVDGATWAALEGPIVFNQATGRDNYEANTFVDFGGVQAKFVRITINAGYGMIPQWGLSEVRFLYIPTRAREPKPADGSTASSANVTLAWRSGREAALSEVYLGTDAANLPQLGTTTENSLAVNALDYSTAYFWSVTEVNNAEAVSAYVGPIWSFVTPDFGVVDDFDQYNDNCERIFFAWLDGLGHSGGEDIDDCDVAPSNGNGGGSIVGNDVAPFAERTIVTTGSRQSMPFNYDNAFGQSEATLTIGGEDWTASGVQTLAIAFYGTADNTGTLYVKINNIKITYDGDASDIASSIWQPWNIDLTAASGLQNVQSLTIGVDGATAKGMLYFDDIRLYPGPGD